MATRNDALAIARQLDGTLRSLFESMVRSHDGLIVLQGELDRFTLGQAPGDKQTAQLVARAFVRRQRLAFSGDVRDRAERFLIQSARGRIPEPKPPNRLSASVHIDASDGVDDWIEMARRQERLAPPLTNTLERAWTTMASSVSWASFAKAAQIANSMRTGEFFAEFGRSLAAEMGKTLVGYMYNSAYTGMLGAVSAPSPAFLDTATDRAANWSGQYAARLIKDLTDEQESAFKYQIQQSFQEGFGPEELAFRLRNQGLGLHRRYTIAVDRHYQGLLEQGVSRGVARDQATNYASRLRRHRSDVIARTEVMYGINWGRMELWNAAIQHDDLNSDVGKKWVTALDERVCPVCRPLNGVVVGLYEHFDLPPEALRSGQKGNLFLPPAHPQCRCTMVLAPVRDLAAA